MKKVIFPFFTLLLIAACQKENLQDDRSTQTQAAESRDNGNNLVTICHKLGNGQYNVIQVNQNAVPAHLAHGDKLVDADGDGYTAPDCCTGTMDDCDDNNASVNPGATEICDNELDDDCDGYTDSNDSDCAGGNSCFDAEFLEANGPYLVYYDSDVETCDIGFGEASEVVVLFGEGVIFLAATSLEGDQKIVAFQNQITGEFCLLALGENMTEQDYDNAAALLRAYIAAHPEMPNYCDLFPNRPSGSSDARTAFEKFKNVLPTEMQKKFEKN